MTDLLCGDEVWHDPGQYRPEADVRQRKIQYEDVQGSSQTFQLDERYDHESVPAQTQSADDAREEHVQDTQGALVARSGVVAG